MAKKHTYLAPSMRYYSPQMVNMMGICAASITGGSLNDFNENSPSGNWTYDD